MELPKNVTAFRDRHGRIRYRFRKTGLPARCIGAEPGTSDFEHILTQARAGLLPPPRPRKEPKQPRPGQVVYFVGCGDAIKIGTTANLPRRLRALATGTHEQVVLLAMAPGGTVLEGEYHKRFAASRIRREWFKRSPEIESEIADLANRGDPGS